MRQHLKRRLAVFLSVMMILPTVISVLPMASREVTAASSYTSMYWKWSSTAATIQVEKGQKFYIGDYVGVSTTDSKGDYWLRTATMVNATYKSSKTSVASVNKKGYVSAKKAGTTTITVKYSGKKVTTKIKVVPKGTFQVSTAVAGIKKQAASLAKKFSSKITTKNGYNLIKAVDNYKAAVGDSQEIGISGILKELTTSAYSNYSYYAEKDKLAVPQAGRYYTLEAMLNEYAQKNNPTSTRSAKVLKIKSASATTSAITLKLSGKVSASQVLAARILSYGEDRQISGTSKAYISVYFYDANGKAYYQGRGELKKGSATIKITPQKFSNTGYINTKLTKGHSYILGYKDEWTKGKKVKVK